MKFRNEAIFKRFSAENRQYSAKNSGIAPTHLADRFQVSYSFASRLLKRYQATKSVESSLHGGGKLLLLNSQQINVVIQLVEEDNDATLEQLCARLLEKTGTRVSVPTMCRLLQRLELTRKKKTFQASEAQTLRV